MGLFLRLLASLADPTRPRYRAATLPKPEDRVACHTAAVSALLRTRLRAHHEEETPVPQISAALRHELAVANRILGHEGVIDAFGHVSLRHPERPGPLSPVALARAGAGRARRHSRVHARFRAGRAADRAALCRAGHPRRNLQGAARRDRGVPPSRGGDHAVRHQRRSRSCRCSISAPRWAPVVPFWDSRDDFGDTNLLVVKPEEGASLARALGKQSMVLMRRHGATVVGATCANWFSARSIPADNARYLSEAKRLGNFGPLHAGRGRAWPGRSIRDAEHSHPRLGILGDAARRARRDAGAAAQARAKAEAGGERQEGRAESRAAKKVAKKEVAAKPRAVKGRKRR